MTVSYDNRLVDSIYVHSLDGKSAPYVATLTSRSEKYRGLSFDEVAYYEGLREAVRIQSEHFRLQNRIDFANTVKPVVDSAKKRLKTEGSNKSRSARRADTKAERNHELGLERKVMAKIDGGTVTEQDVGMTVATTLNRKIVSGISVVGSGDNSGVRSSMEGRLAAARARMRI